MSVLQAVFGLVVGAMFSVLSVLGAFGSEEPNSALIGAIVGVGAIVIFPIFYAVIGFVAALIAAALYNAVAGVLGGVEMDVQ